MKDIFLEGISLLNHFFGGEGPRGKSRYPQIFVILKCYLFNIKHPQLCIPERWDKLEHSKQLRKLVNIMMITESSKFEPCFSVTSWNLKGFIRVWQWPWKEAEILSVEANQSLFWKANGTSSTCIDINLYISQIEWSFPLPSQLGVNLPNNIPRNRIKYIKYHYWHTHTFHLAPSTGIKIWSHQLSALQWQFEPGRYLFEKFLDFDL